MVFKGRFFSSKKSSSSPESSNTNSPRSTSSNASSPIKSKKPNNNNQPPSFRQIQVKDAPAVSSSPIKKSPITTRSDVSGKVPTSSSDSGKVTVSPILASSLGLNRIKTRSGPLPQESYFSFGKESGNAKVGASNLSKMKKEEEEKEKEVAVKAWEKTPSGGGGGGGLGRSRLQNGESSSEAAGVSCGNTNVLVKPAKKFDKDGVYMSNVMYQQIVREEITLSTKDA